MFRFIKQIFISAMMFFSSLPNINSLECISLKNQECKVRPEIVNINSNDPIFYPFSTKTNKCGGNCNNINYPYTRICIPDTVKNLNIKVFNLMSLTNETRHIEWYETWKCICRLNGIICNSKQRWNKDKCGCKCKELIDRGVCNKGFIWNLSNCECECDKSCDIGEYLDNKNCKCRKKLIESITDECTETTEEVRIAKITLENGKSYYKYSSCKVYIVFMMAFFIIFTISTGIIIYFVYYNWSFIKNNVFCIKSNAHKETIIWWMQYINGRIKTNKH